MYNLQPDNPTSLTESSLNNFLKAKSNFEQRDQRRREEEAKVCHLILSSLSEEAQMHLRSVGAFTKAIDDNDSYAVFSIAKDEHSRSSSFAVLLQEMQNYDLNKKKATPKQEATVPVGLTILSAPSPNLRPSAQHAPRCLTCSSDR